jgi:L-asparagine transporter-like permease
MPALTPDKPNSPAPATNARATAATREDDLARRLTPRQLAMIALGGSIGTGLFLGSGIIQLAGPGVIISYILAAFPALFIAWALAEMAVAHPVAGSFGVYAEIYLNPWAGFTMRYSYWLAQVIAIGSEVVAAAIYFHFWYPQVPGWLLVIVFSVALLAANAWSVASFGEFEYWFALIKVAAIVAFLFAGVGLLFGFGPLERVGFANYTEHGGFFPHGLKGILLAMSMGTFSYIGIEVVAVAAGEAQDPKTSIPRALKSVFWRLGLFYIGGITLLVGLLPWSQAGTDASPFVRAFEGIGLPFASGFMNFVVLTAALSSANTNLYMTSRMLYSLSRGGYAPKKLGTLTKRGIPLWALVTSSGGLVAGAIAKGMFPERAFLYMISAAFFGAIFVWIMIFVTHLVFRRRRGGEAGLQTFMPAFPIPTLLGLGAMVFVSLSTLFIDALRITLPAGLIFLSLLSLAYWVWRWRQPKSTDGS